jgi:predicted phosphodiesterase
VRYAIIADVHGNLPALRATIEAADRAGADAYLCAGDLVGYGPHPNECVELLASLNAVCVAGNHDLMALGRLSDERCVRLARRSLAWTREVLSEPARRYLANLPIRRAVDDRIVLSHGSWDDPQEYVLRRQQAEVQLGRLASAGAGATVLVLGHTHTPSIHGEQRGAVAARPGHPVDLARRERHLLNPGAVGQSRGRVLDARLMLLDLEPGRVIPMAVRYDAGSVRRDLRRHNLPAESVHLRRPAWRRLAGAARTRVRARG